MHKMTRTSMILYQRLVTFAVISIVLFSVDVIDCTGFNYLKLRQEFEDALQSRRESVAKQHLQEYLLYRYWHPEERPAGFVSPSYPDMYLEQPLDHFDSQERGTYLQRYWVNRDHWRGEGGPVFLYIGGEGGLTSEVVQSGEHYELAVKYGALIFAVEHRFYGKSLNPDGLELNNLQYLSSQQALADLAGFHSLMTKEYNLNDKNVWISFGGSYPGMLSAWFRLKYPHLVFGAIATSAPVLAQVNNEGYNDVVANSFSNPVVNGSQLCAANIQEAFKTMDALLDEGEFELVSQDFKSCTVVKEPKDVHQLVSNVADLLLVTVQINEVLPGLRNISSVCAEMTQPGKSYDNLKNVYQTYFPKKENCTDNSWDKYIQHMSHTSAEEGFWMRPWLYQTCSQFGFYQTCYPETSCLFSHRLTIDPNLAICMELFGIQPQDVYKNVEFTNAYYGGNQPAGTRIVFVNGSIDPWHALSVLRNLSSTETSIFINGTSHCANMESDRKTDPPALRMARKKIDEQIGKWLEEAHGQIPEDTNLYFRPI